MEMSASRCILFSAIGGHFYEEALKWYNVNIRRESDKIILLCVIEPLDVIFELKGSYNCRRIEQDMITAATNARLCCSAVKEIIGNRDCTSIQVYSMEPGQSIVKTMEEEKAELLIMARGDSNSANLSHQGSVSDYVIHHSSVPVLLIPVED